MPNPKVKLGQRLWHELREWLGEDAGPAPKAKVYDLADDAADSQPARRAQPQAASSKPPVARDEYPDVQALDPTEASAPARGLKDLAFPKILGGAESRPTKQVGELAPLAVRKRQGMDIPNVAEAELVLKDLRSGDLKPSDLSKQQIAALQEARISRNILGDLGLDDEMYRYQARGLEDRYKELTGLHLKGTRAAFSDAGTAQHEGTHRLMSLLDEIEPGAEMAVYTQVNKLLGPEVTEKFYYKISRMPQYGVPQAKKALEEARKSGDEALIKKAEDHLEDREKAVSRELLTWLQSDFSKGTGRTGRKYPRSQARKRRYEEATLHPDTQAKMNRLAPKAAADLRGRERAAASMTQDERLDYIEAWNLHEEYNRRVLSMDENRAAIEVVRDLYLPWHREVRKGYQRVLDWAADLDRQKLRKLVEEYQTNQAKTDKIAAKTEE